METTYQSAPGLPLQSTIPEALHDGPASEAINSAACGAPTIFTKFPDLPVEIQLQIWQHALPDPRSIRGAIVIHLNYNLGRPRAILPSIIELKSCYYHWRELLEDLEDDEESSERKYWQTGNQEMAALHRLVFNLLHACQRSRSVALETYRLDLDSIIPAENVPLWAADDDVYFSFNEIPWFRELMFHWLRNTPSATLASIRHISFVVGGPLLFAMGVFDDGGPRWDLGWMQNFPHLQSLSLLIDPGYIRTYTDGKILLYEPEDFRMDNLNHMLPSELERRVTKGFEDTVADGQEVPLVETFVIGRRAPKRSRRRVM